MEEKMFCPKCRSINVKVNITASLVLEAPQVYLCNNCGYQNYLFPKLTKLKENKK